MTTLKIAIIDLIDQGYNNADIVEALACSNDYVRMLRAEYYHLTGQRKRSRHTKPKSGTKWREVYEFFLANPKATCAEASLATGANRGSCYKLRSYYLITTSEKPKLRNVNVINHVTLDDLELIE